MTHARRVRAVDIAGAVLAIAACAVVVVRLRTLPPAALRQFLAGNIFWILELQFAFVVIGFAANALPLWRRLTASRGAALSAAAASVVAAVLSGVVAPQTNRIFYDEHIYENIGQQLSDNRRAEICNDGIVQYGRLDCRRGEYNKEPAGYPYLLSVLYRIAGAHEWIAFRFNNLCAALIVVVVFAAAALLFEDSTSAAFAAWIAALIPQLLRWSNTAAAEPSAALFGAAAFMCAVWYARARTSPALLWLISTTTFAATIRPESGLILLVAAAVVALLAGSEFQTQRLWWGAALASVLILPTLVHMLAVRDEHWGAPAASMSVSFFRLNLASNGPFYLNNRQFPAVFTLLAAAGALFMRSRWRENVLLVVYFVAFWGIFLFFYAGSYYYGADVRYSLTTYAPIVIAAGAGAAAAARAIAARAVPSSIATVAVAAATGAQFLLFMPLVRSTGEESWAARADVEIAREFARSIPRDSIVLTHNPSMFQLWGRNAAQASIAVDDEQYVKAVLLHQHRPIYFYWNFWCNVDDPVQVRFCEQILQRYDTTLVAERRELTYRYGLYKLNPVNTER